MSSQESGKSYNALYIFGWLLLLLGTLIFGLGTVITGLSTIFLAGSDEYSNDASVMLSYGALIPSLLSGLIGIFMGTAGALALAVRDIAIHSGTSSPQTQVVHSNPI